MKTKKYEDAIEIMRLQKARPTTKKRKKRGGAAAATKKKVVAKKAPLPWTPELETRLHRVAWSVWEEIASDAISGLQECEGRSYYRGDEMVELVGEYIVFHGRRLDPEAVDAYLALSYADQDEVLGRRFEKRGRYGY